ncbi:unnamed protein product [Cylicocyclus nassatus]|uniref:Uncharacterized protein n=1 Tax=Cylicocyclus nassatus TaxID=53992 RepID=A0AA36H0Z0_CYLNA|nr:unnamed protein product [Cylicocyclus nassatus]
MEKRIGKGSDNVDEKDKTSFFYGWGEDGVYAPWRLVVVLEQGQINQPKALIMVFHWIKARFSAKDWSCMTAMPSTPLTKRIVTGTITITDYEKKQRRPRPEFASMPEDQYCLLRSHLVIALVVFCILSIIQLFVLLNCLHSRCTSLPDNASYSTATSSTSRSYISSCHYRSASLEMSKPLPPTPSELALSQPYQVSATSR